jgi:UDP-glucose:(heptosyl)LPS alpha-1,3-glucosyltransferase
MKIGLIRRRFAPSGGAELYLQRLLIELTKRGYEPHLIAEEWKNVDQRVTVHRVNRRGGRAYGPINFAEAVRDLLPPLGLDCTLSLERTIAQDVYRAGDGVHRVWLQNRRQFSAWWKKPFVGLGAFHRTMMALEEQTFDPNNTRHIIVNSEKVRREILQNFAFPEDRIHLIRNGVDVDRMRSGDRRTARQRFGISASEFVVGFVGSGWERKGLHFLIRALRLVSDVHSVRLLVAGKGTRPFLAPSNAIFCGPIREVELVYAATDLIVTLPVYEPCANVVSEAIAAGIPVVTSVQNGASELLEEGITGTIVSNPADAATVSAAILKWIRSRSGNRYKLDVSDFAITRNVTQTLELLEKVYREKREGGR